MSEANDLIDFFLSEAKGKGKGKKEVVPETERIGRHEVPSTPRRQARADAFQAELNAKAGKPPEPHRVTGHQALPQYTRSTTTMPAHWKTLLANVKEIGKLKRAEDPSWTGKRIHKLQSTVLHGLQHLRKAKAYVGHNDRLAVKGISTKTGDVAAPFKDLAIMPTPTEMSAEQLKTFRAGVSKAVEAGRTTRARGTTPAVTDFGAPPGRGATVLTPDHLRPDARERAYRRSEAGRLGHQVDLAAARVKGKHRLETGQELPTDAAYEHPDVQDLADTNRARMVGHRTDRKLRKKAEAAAAAKAAEESRPEDNTSEAFENIVSNLLTERRRAYANPYSRGMRIKFRRGKPPSEFGSKSKRPALTHTDRTPAIPLAPQPGPTSRKVFDISLAAGGGRRPGQAAASEAGSEVKVVADETKKFFAGNKKEVKKEKAERAAARMAANVAKALAGQISTDTPLTFWDKPKPSTPATPLGTPATAREVTLPNSGSGRDPFETAASYRSKDKVAVELKHPKPEWVKEREKKAKEKAAAPPPEPAEPAEPETESIKDPVSYVKKLTEIVARVADPRRDKSIKVAKNMDSPKLAKTQFITAGSAASKVVQARLALGAGTSESPESTTGRKAFFDLFNNETSK